MSASRGSLGPCYLWFPWSCLNLLFWWSWPPPGWILVKCQNDGIFSVDISFGILVMAGWAVCVMGPAGLLLFVIPAKLPWFGQNRHFCFRKYAKSIFFVCCYNSYCRCRGLLYCLLRASASYFYLSSGFWGVFRRWDFGRFVFRNLGFSEDFGISHDF